MLCQNQIYKQKDQNQQFLEQADQQYLWDQLISQEWSCFQWLMIFLDGEVQLPI